MKATVTVMLKQGVLDPQGEAIRHALGALGFEGVEGVRQGKVIELDLAPICRAVADHAVRGGFVLGVCNGFQVLTETHLLPGALMRNAGLKFICKTATLRVTSVDSPFTAGYDQDQLIQVPIAHHDGNYAADDETLAKLRDNDQIVFTYDGNPNGSVEDIAGVISENRRVLGMMPHPERAVDDIHGSTDGRALFRSLVGQLADA
ncbi:MAG: phosphoribosylformylglycinamidine synthase subunit PurQ [Loktanella sp.]|nr:phosphoribosylformylglycinamidine synthase subunit PurQ [Loktanella sp.]